MPDGYIVKEHAAITVLAPVVTAAAADAATLTSYGYNVTGSAATQQTITAPVIVDKSKGKDPYTLHYLQNHFGVKAVKTLPAGVTVANPNAKFVIIEPK
jgi:hypothetical protein